MKNMNIDLNKIKAGMLELVDSNKNDLIDMLEMKKAICDGLTDCEIEEALRDTHLDCDLEGAIWELKMIESDIVNAKDLYDLRDAASRGSALNGFIYNDFDEHDDCDVDEEILDYFNQKQVYCIQCNEPVTFVDDIDFEVTYNSPVSNGRIMMCDECEVISDTSHLYCVLKCGNEINYAEYLQKFVHTQDNIEDVILAFDFIADRNECISSEYSIVNKRYIEINVYDDWQVVIEIEPNEDGTVYLGFWIKGQDYSQMSFMYGHFQKDGKLNYENDFEVVQDNLHHIINNVDDFIESYLEKIECLEGCN
ncbi:hypothetical protein [Fusibacter tunisiensis]|uniref:EF-hand domain-containing protein n=1 Tax=Fusibacter tunisiensis TaxID=1008308 RepID=A0ABS2MTV2_9FIRM|nr:hypothetical protein [Fusibacter tunisiensis]MBM7562854.1 hypothetical protein [Fusibacter tunisiensis]